MNWLFRALSSSIGQKFVMAITGLLLCGFLVVHLAGNLLLYVSAREMQSDSPPAVNRFNEYAHALHSQGALLLVAEVGLFALFAFHILLAFRTASDNRRARRARYAEQHSKKDPGFLIFDSSKWMFFTGMAVLVFLILHLIDMRFELRPDVDYAAFKRGAGVHGEDAFGKTVAVLETPLTGVVYFIGTILLGVHLGHGVRSAFQTLGINHSKYNTLIRVLGVVFAVVIAVGFASFPVWALLRA